MDDNMEMVTELQRALAFYQPPPESWYSGIQRKIEATGQWLWETLQGDFNDNQSTAQVVTGTVISMIPFVDQICDVRDLIANCKKIKEGNDKNEDTTWAWVAMILTLVGLIPVAGSLIKGIFKMLFNSIRKAALSSRDIVRAIDASVSLFNKFIDLPAVQATMKWMKIYNPYTYAEKQVRELMAQLNVSVLLSKLDELMDVTGSLLEKAKSWGPESIRQPIEVIWELLVSIRSQANTMLAKALAPLNDVLEKLAARLHREGDDYYKAHTGANPHRPSRLKDAEEVELLATKKPDWADIGGKEKYPQLEKASAEQKRLMDPENKEGGYPNIPDDKVQTFHQMAPVEFKEGEKLYRVLDPGSSDNSFCWMREAEFKALKSKSQWRRRFAVWKSWNENGEYVVYTVPPGTTMKVWEGPAASQVREVTGKNGENIKVVLEGGSLQIVIDPTVLNLDYLGKRQSTGWGYRDFSDEVDMYIGVPQLQTNIYVPK
ncbi:hypothetical protein ABL777_004227 [Escherichia coli]